MNAEVNGLFAALFLLAMALILFISMKQYDMKVVMLTVSFIISIISVVFWSMGFIGVEIMIIPLIILFMSILVRVFGEN